MQTEINWLTALRATDRAEQSAAVTALREVLQNGLRIALKSRNDVSEAHLEDFAQDGLLRILDQLEQFQGRSKFTTWAQAIALNTAFTELRKKRWQDISLDALMANGEHLSDPSMIADEVLGANEDSTRLVTALRDAINNELTPKQRAAILGELHEMPFDQIAELLGMNRNAAYKLVHDARRALRKYLTQSGITGADIQNAFYS
jgi:RNA polymerase sigma-70 factor, ECF subfamily